MTNSRLKIAFLCSWGRGSRDLYNYYKLYTPKHAGVWEHLVGCTTVEEADVVFIMEGIASHQWKDTTLIKQLSSKKLFVIRHEPPDVYPSNSSMVGLNAIPPELRDKAIVVDYTKHPIWYFSKPELIESHSHEELLSMSHQPRTKKLSCLVSGKTMITGHRKRLDFINRLIKDSPEILTLYGRNNIPYHNHRGSLTAKEKYLAYEGFEYTLCFENSQVLNYFSDKLFDAILMWSMPIYWGAPNVREYLPVDAFYTLSKDLNDTDIEMVKSVCKRPPTEKNIKAIEEARELIINKYSLWPSLQYVLETYN
jgi:hypothetical protein